MELLLTGYHKPLDVLVSPETVGLTVIGTAIRIVVSYSSSATVTPSSIAETGAAAGVGAGAASFFVAFVALGAVCPALSSSTAVDIPRNALIRFL